MIYINNSFFKVPEQENNSKDENETTKTTMLLQAPKIIKNVSNIDIEVTNKKSSIEAQNSVLLKNNVVTLKNGSNAILSNTTILPVSQTGINILTPLSSNSNKIKQSSSQVVLNQKENATVVANNLTSQSDSYFDLMNSKLNTLPFMDSCVKVLDENLHWCESLQDYLQDSSDFLVVGILGKKGVGKSTLMSLLASGSKYDPINNKNELLFKPSQHDINELGQHKTDGINAFITNERTILLDVQPLLSGSVLDKTINMDKKYFNNDFKYFENYVELQSIELACFILSVCNVVLLAEDWFTDPNLFR